MEFIDYLDKAEIEIVKLVEQVGYALEENTSLCLISEKYVGFLKKKQKRIVMCTDNAKKIEGYTILRNKNTDTFDRTALHIKKALRHEAVHVAQECNNGKLLKLKRNLSLNPSKINALNGSIKISGAEEKEKEKQAYILEDKPKLVLMELKKYCM